MEKNDLIIVGTVGGALVLIIWLASKNKNKADEGMLPYGWGSFQNSDNRLTPFPVDYTGARPSPVNPPDDGARDDYTPPHNWLPVIKDPVGIEFTPMQPKVISPIMPRPRVNTVIKPVKPLEGVI